MKHDDFKVVPAPQLAKMNFKELPFTGKWLVFLGKPEPNFYMVIESAAGIGKSTFALEFADYLAKRFGKTMFISNEEGIRGTTKLKINRVAKEPSKNLLIVESSNFELIREKLRGDFKDCKFVFIDSLDNGHISDTMMSEIRGDDNQRAFIAISQNTKAGNMKGFSTRLHDPDILVKVYRDDKKKVYAKTTKNRYNDLKEMRIW